MPKKKVNLKEAGQKPEPVLQEDLSQEEIKKVLYQKTKYQKKAILYKNITLQKRQLSTNIAQLFVPIFGLCFMMFVRQGVLQNTDSLFNESISIPIPFFYNIPMQIFDTFGILFNTTTCDEWYMYKFDDGISEKDKEYFGRNDGSFLFDEDGNMGKFQDRGEGLLKSQNIMQMPCKEVNKSVPYFQEIENKSLTLNENLYDILDRWSDVKLDMKFKTTSIDGLEELPDATLLIQEANKKNFSYRLQVNNHQFYQYHRLNGFSQMGYIRPGVISETNDSTTIVNSPSEGAMQLANRMNQAYIHSVFNDTYVVSGQQFMPFKPNVRDQAEKLTNSIGEIVYPIMISLSLPIFLYTLVLEKETKLVQNMKVNGMQDINYQLTNYVFNFIQYLVTAFVYLGFGRYVTRLSFFTQSNEICIVLAFIGYGLCQISMAFFFSCFLNNSQTSTMIGYAVTILVSIICSTLLMVRGINHKDDDETMYEYLHFYPIFPFNRVVFIFADQCAWDKCISSYENVPDEVFRCIRSLYLAAFVIMVLAVYLNQVVPQQYGIPKHPLYFMEDLIKSISADLHKKVFGDDSDLKAYKDDNELADEDQDAKDEREKIRKLTKSEYQNYPLLVKDIRKVYPGVNGRSPKVANKNISMVINSGELFGLLGPNGAGKTTLISQLTGLYQPTCGNAWIGGFSLNSQLEIVQLQIGVCPQFDVLWDLLTVDEHLLFYARVKGVTPELEDKYVTKALTEVQLLDQRNIQVLQLPLGMRRRLSIAISLVSNPKVVFLDEPTTGLDPETRRQLWNILQDCKKDKNRAMILTTHSMEEADILCNRIGIVNNGVLTCIGSQNRLKDLYGGGYHLFINCEKTQNTQFTTNTIKNIEAFISKHLPGAIQLRYFNSQFVYQVPQEGFEPEQLFTEMEDNKKKLKIADWGISQCSLEDVFTKICDLD